MKIPALLSLFLALLSPAATGAALAPANPQANAKTRAVLDFIGSLGARADKRLLSGQFTDYGTKASLELPEKIHRQTGHWPALIGVNYAEFPDPDDSQKSSLTSRVPNQVAIAYWRAGGLVTVDAHLYNPANPHGGGLGDPGVDLDGLLAPGTVTHRRWMQELDVLAAGLQELREAGVVVLWRPFHEMNGHWFWWGEKDPAAFIRVWRHMFDYFTRAKGLDNLLWVYAPNHGDNTAAYYPGDGHVDVVGLDAYTDFVDPEHIHGHAEVARLPKPFAFCEYSARVPGKSPPPYDYRRFMPGLTANFPHTVYFMNWNAKWSPANNQHAKELYDHPWIMNREDLPPGLAGRAP